jgi:hypothetical protein
MSYKVRNRPSSPAAPVGVMLTREDQTICRSCGHAASLHGEYGGCRHNGFLCPCFYARKTVMVTAR